MSEYLPLILTVIFLGSIFSVLAGGGMGIILLITLSFFFDVYTTIVLMVLIGFVIQPAKAFHFGKYTDWRIVKLYVILGLPLSFLGARLLFAIPQRQVELLIATLCMLFVASRLSKWKFSIKPTTKIVVLMGAVNGFQGGVMGLGNFVRNPFLLSLGLRKEEFIGTAAVLSIILNIGKIIIYVPNIVWTTDVTILFCGSIIPVFAGISIGKRLLPLVSHAVFEMLLLVVIVAGAAKIILFP